MSKTYLAHKEILKQEDLILNDEDRKVIDSFDLELTSNRVALYMLKVEPTESKVHLLTGINGQKNIDGKQTRQGEIDPKYFPMDPGTAIVVAAGPGFEDTSGIRKTRVKKGDHVFIDISRSGADNIMVNKIVYAIIREDQITAIGKNLL